MSNRNSILCPNCKRLISRDEPHCPHCNLKNPGSFLKNNPLMRGMSDGGSLLRAIIYTNVGIYIVSMMLFAPSLSLGNPFNALSPSGNSLILLGGTGTITIDRLGMWWSLLSANYLHGSLLHIIFNMLAVSRIGALIINLYGPYRMFSIYTLTGISGFVLSYFAGVRLTIGASAAICGLIGAALYYGKSRGGVQGQAVYQHTMGWVVGLFLFGLMPNINNWGHAGGLLSGILLGYLFSYRERRPERFGDKALAVFCVLISVLVLGWAVLSGIFLRITG